MNRHIKRNTARRGEFIDKSRFAADNVAVFVSEYCCDNNHIKVKVILVYDFSNQAFAVHSYAFN